jgi:SpoVK/Ycf46/Vps4 family AAA+-type ATPase
MESSSKKERDHNKTNISDESNEVKTNNLFENIFYNAQCDQFVLKPSDHDIKLHQVALENAPNKIKALIARENCGPKGYKHRINRLLFIGVPGVGKSLLAKAMACQIGKCFFIKHSAVMKKYRNETSNLLIKILREIVEQPGKNVIVIDEINKLTDNHKSEHSDSGITAATLWTFMDEQQTNPNCYIIGTTNHSKKLPEELQSRFHSATVTISTPDVNTRRNVLRKLIMESDLQCDPNMTAFLDILAQQTENYSIRDLEQLIWDAENFAYQLHRNKPYIDQSCLESALKARQDEDRNAWDTNQESDEEKRHKELLRSHQAMHNESIRVQRELHEQNARMQQDMFDGNVRLQQTMHKDNLQNQNQAASAQMRQAQEAMNYQTTKDIWNWMSGKQ